MAMNRRSFFKSIAGFCGALVAGKVISAPSPVKASPLSNSELKAFWAGIRAESDRESAAALHFHGRTPREMDFFAANGYWPSELRKSLWKHGCKDEDMLFSDNPDGSVTPWCVSEEPIQIAALTEIVGEYRNGEWWYKKDGQWIKSGLSQHRL